MESICHGPRPTTCSSSALCFDRERVGKWVLERVPNVEGWGPFEAIGLEKHGALVAGTVYNYYSGTNIVMSWAAVPGKRWLTREYLQAIFRYPFMQLQCRRVTGYIASRNSDSLRFATKLGAKMEGVLEHYLPDDDVVVMGILKENCRWLEIV